MIPRELYLFWHSATLPPLVAGAMRLLRQATPGWAVHMLDAAVAEREFGIGPPPAFTGNKTAWTADYYRLEMLASRGGVWLDSSVLLLQPLESWLNVSSDAMLGFGAPWSNLRYPTEDMEGFAIATPRGHPLMLRWRDEFRRALRLGFETYCARLPRLILSAGTAHHLPLLTMNAAWLRARYGTSLVDAPAVVLSSVAPRMPYQPLLSVHWSSARLAESLLGGEPGSHVLPRHTHVHVHVHVHVHAHAHVRHGHVHAHVEWLPGCQRTQSNPFPAHSLLTACSNHHTQAPSRKLCSALTS